MVINEFAVLELLSSHKEGCKHYQVTGDYCGRPWGAAAHMLCEHCTAIIEDAIKELERMHREHSLSQPSLIESTTSDEVVGNVQRGVKAGELKTESSDKAKAVREIPKHAPCKGRTNGEAIMTLCNYCGEEEGVAFITDPNYSETLQPDWWVCADCKKMIPEQQFEAIKAMLEYTRNQSYDEPINSVRRGE